MTDENDNFDVSRWVDDRDLAVCPQCGELRLTPPSPATPGHRVCLNCGVLTEPEL